MQMNTITLITLNNLALANKDRMDAYQQAIDLMQAKENSTTDCTDLLAFFSNYLNDSRAFNNQLAQLAGDDLYVPAGRNEEAGSLNAYTCTSTALTPDRSKVLEVCYKGEEQTGKIYEYALNEEAIPADTKNILLRQKEEVLRAQKILASLLQRAA